MDTFELKATPVEGLWELARLDSPSNKAPDFRVEQLARWLAVKIDPTYPLESKGGNGFYPHHIQSTGKQGWHIDGYSSHCNYIMLMCHKEPTTEFSNCPLLVLGVNRHTRIYEGEELQDFKAEVGVVYLVYYGILHRAPVEFSYDRPFSRMGIRWPKEIYDQAAR